MESLKSGWQSSEFILKLLAVIIAVVLPMLPVGTPAEKIVSVIAVILAALGYTASRTAVKTTALKADALTEASVNPPPPGSTS